MDTNVHVDTNSAAITNIPVAAKFLDSTNVHLGTNSPGDNVLTWLKQAGEFCQHNWLLLICFVFVILLVFLSRKSHLVAGRMRAFGVTIRDWWAKQCKSCFRAFKIVRRFLTLLKLHDNRARLLVLLLCGLACIAPWMALSEMEDEKPYQSQWFAWFSSATTLLGVGVGAVVLIKLEKITSTEEFLVQLIELLRDVHNNDTLVFIAPSFNIQSIPKSDLFSAFKVEIKNCLKRGAIVKLCYSENRIDPKAYIELNTIFNGDVLSRKQQAWIDKWVNDSGLASWTSQVLEWKYWEKRHEYFQGVYSFLQELRNSSGQAKLIETVYPPLLVDGHQYAVLIGNTSNKNFLIGRFDVSPDAPQEVRVACDAEYIRSKNKHIGEALAKLLTDIVGSATQHGQVETAPP